MAVLLALGAAYGVFLLYTGVAFGWRGLSPGPSPLRRTARRDRAQEFLVQAGLEDVRLIELVAVIVVLAVVGAGLAYSLFGGVLAPLAVALACALLPVSSARRRRRVRITRARDAWPRMIEEIRLQAVTLGRSIPQALLAVGMRGPVEFQPAFEAANRTWLLRRDFPATVRVLKERLADPTADVICETLLVAHEVGGSDIDRRLTALMEDRIADLQGRKDAISKQAGARFARRFVIAVPIGMALAGLQIGNGRAAYATPVGQAGVLVGLAIMAVCWLWAGRIMRLPEQDRVFAE